MKIITEEVFANFECKKSIFLSFVFPFSFFEERMMQLRLEHSKAVHFVYAYRFFQDGQILERFSDDGEPKGSSGMPVLSVLRGYNMVNTAAIVVRYFGGTLLGVGGLVRAYTNGVVSCLKEAEAKDKLKDFLIQEQRIIHCPYALLSRVEYCAKVLDISLQKEEFGVDNVVLRLYAQKDKLELFESQYKELHFKGVS